MFDWIFGKKQQKKEEPKKEDNSKISAEDMWMYDCLTQYLSSPLWRIPIVDFLEANCIYFEDSQENKFEYTKIFQNFRELVAGMVDNMVKELGISDDLLERCLNKGLRSKQHKLFEQILVVDNFEAFKRIMIKKNKELELEAMLQISAEKSTGKDVEISELELERMEMERAIAISLALKDKMSEEEERMIQEAIKQSEIDEQKRIEAQLAKQKQKEVPKELPKEQPKQVPKAQQKKPSLASLSSLPPLILPSAIKEQPIAELKKESEEIEKRVTELKKEQKELDKEDAEQRKKRLNEQRELLRKKKQEERAEEMKQFVEGKAATKEEPKVSESELERRKNLMKRLKAQLE